MTITSALTVSDAANDLIITEEVSGPNYYNKHYTHFEWPAGASGPTIAIGYDCGYVTQVEASQDWAGIVTEDALEHIHRACGLRGEVAASFVRLHKYEVTITWDQAIKEFKEREVPKWLLRVERALPNCNLLSPDSLGALLSLSYNRGTGGYGDPHSRFAEMRAIRGMMVSENFSKIPGEILSMRRLWPPGGGLWRRREHEAELFRRGLNK